MYLVKHLYAEALGAYNAGEANRQAGIDNGYAGSLAAKHKAWVDILPDEEEEPHPEVNLVPNEDGWLADPEAGRWARARDLPNAIIRTDNNGWLWVPKQPQDDFAWPVADDPPREGDYVARHPTRYNWLPERPDVEGWARWLVRNRKCWVNTYHDHPVGFGRDKNSIDVWSPKGRGHAIDPNLGQEIFGLLLNDPNPPDIEWIIWRRRIYSAANNWLGAPWGEDPFTWHDDHIHVTYRR